MILYPLAAWYDFWVGVFVQRHKKTKAVQRVFILPLPCLGIVLDFTRSGKAARLKNKAGITVDGWDVEDEDLKSCHAYGHGELCGGCYRCMAMQNCHHGGRQTTVWRPLRLRAPK